MRPYATSVCGLIVVALMYDPYLITRCIKRCVLAPFICVDLFFFFCLSSPLFYKNPLQKVAWHFFPSALACFYSAANKHTDKCTSEFRRSTLKVNITFCIHHFPKWNMMGVHFWAAQASVFNIVSTWHLPPWTLAFFLFGCKLITKYFCFERTTSSNVSTLW